MAFTAVRSSEVPAFGIIADRINAINPEISISATAYDSDRKLYCLRFLGPTGRNADLHLSREQLDDLADNPTSPTSKYTMELMGNLDKALLETIETSGLISFGEEALKFSLLKFVAQEQKNGRSINKYNTVGKAGPGTFELWLKTELTSDERDSLIWVWNELVRLRLIAPTGTDLISPDDWVKVTERGLAAIEGKSFTEYAEIEAFISKGEVYTAFRILQRIFQQARSDVVVIDPYIDEQVLDHVAETHPSVKVLIVTEHVKGNFKIAYKKLVQQRGNLEARVVAHFHDRFIIVDSKMCYQLGSSINHLGNKATVIDLKSGTVRDRVLSEYANLWPAATAL